MQLNHGDGTLGAPLRYSAGEALCDTAIADLNGDGWLDLAGPNYNDDRLAVLLNRGGSRPGDVDDDGDVDLADLAALLGAYGACEGDPYYNPRADLDGSGSSRPRTCFHCCKTTGQARSLG